MTSSNVTRAGSRVAWVDNLRVAAIAGVIVVHTATAYVTDFADWYYDDEMHPTTVGFAVFAIPALMGGIFGLGPLFWLAGWFSVRPLRHRGSGAFVLTRVVRLGVPLVGYVVLVNPLADLVGNVRQEHRSFVDYLGETEFSVMWFVAALLFCACGYAGLRSVVPAGTRPGRPGTGTALAAALIIGLAAVLIWPTTSLLDEHLMSLRLGAWPQGAVLFGLGVLAAERCGVSTGDGVQLGVDRRAERGWGWVTILGVAAIVALLASGGGGELNDVFHDMAWQGVVFAAVYGVVSVSFTLWCLAWFGRRWPGRHGWSARAGRASYATYLFHPLVLTTLMVALSWVPAAPEIKFVVLAAVAIPTCFLTGYALTRLPGARRVL